MSFSLPTTNDLQDEALAVAEGAAKAAFAQMISFGKSRETTQQGCASFAIWPASASTTRAGSAIGASRWRAVGNGQLGRYGQAVAGPRYGAAAGRLARR